MGVTYNTGTITLANDSAAVTGSGTQWVANVQAGWWLIRGTAVLGIVESVNSDTSLTLVRAYAGAGLSDDTYDLVSSGAVRQALADRVQELIDEVQTFIDGPLAGLFGAGTLAEPGVAFAVDPDTGLRRSGSNAVALVAGGVDQIAASGGVASGAAVQSSATDSTAGKLMTVPAFGLGVTGTAPVIANADDPDTPSGWYITNAGTTGTLPVPNGTLEHRSRSAGSATQTFQPTTPSLNVGEVYERGWDSSSSAWTAWRKVYTQGSTIGTVSQASGVPTGALIEKGSNANGEYTRFADGTQFCAIKEFTVADSGAVTWTFPAAFSDADSVTVVATGSNGTTPIVPALGNAATTGVVIRLFSGATRVANVANIFAYGRWF